MNRTIKDATVKRYHYETTTIAPASRRLRRRLQFRPPAEDPQRPHALRVHLQTDGLSEPEQFNLNPLQQMPGLNT